jgi:hypothetical protein
VRVEKVESESGPKKISLPLAYPAERWPALRSIGLPCGALACPAEHWPALRSIGLRGPPFFVLPVGGPASGSGPSSISAKGVSGEAFSRDCNRRCRFGHPSRGVRGANSAALVLGMAPRTRPAIRTSGRGTSGW